jgi:nicotinamide-nucleotide amidase
MDAQLYALAEAVLSAARSRGLMIATAESCTGGLVSGALTEVPGSSDVVERGFVTYSNAAKSDLLGVDPALIEAHGAVSEPVARAMAAGALAASRANISVAVTGVAGPGGSDAKPEGLVHFATAAKNGAVAHRENRFGALGRTNVRRESVRTALEMLMAAVASCD